MKEKPGTHTGNRKENRTRRQISVFTANADFNMQASKKMKSRSFGKKKAYCKKGQMFIIAAIFLIVGLLLIHNLLNVFDLFEESRSTTTHVLDAQLRNIAKEYEYATGVASLNAANVSAMSMLANLSQLVRDDINSRILYAIIFVNGTSSNFSVTVGNYAGDEINVTVNATGSTPAGSNLLVADKTNSTAFFNSSAGLRTITLAYTIRNETLREEFALNITSSYKLQIFYDITLSNSQMLARKKVLYNTTW